MRNLLKLVLGAVLIPAIFSPNVYAESQSFDNNSSQIVRNTATTAVWYFEAGNNSYAAGKYEEAVDNYSNAIAFNSDYSEAFNARGLAYEQLEQYDEAMNDFRSATELDPFSAEAYLNLGRMNLRIGSRSYASTCFERAIELNPNFAEAYKYRGDARELDEYDSKIKDYTCAINLKPDYAAAYNARGLMYNHRLHYGNAKPEDRNLAIADFQKAIQLDPKNTEYRKNLAEMY